jgi:AAA15 family ATPase/GTPase
MLNNLRIKNFRMLEDLEISKLGRVNLIVGKNNSGKSSILEALRVYSGNANPELLRRILISHDEYFNFTPPQNTESNNNWYGLRNFFTNREFPVDDNTFISITSNDSTLIKIEHIFYYIKEERVTDENGIIDFISRRIIIKKSELSNIEQLYQPIPAIRITLKSGKDTTLDLNDDNKKLSRTLFWLLNSDNQLTHSFVSTTFSSAESLAKLWDQITLGPNEDIVIQALRIIDSNIERLAFVENEDKSGRLAIIKLKDSDIRIPLNSMGDGMSRILQLILSVFSARNGFLLIDEFENGLHYSVQEEVWRMIFKLATNLNIQVFATTHSRDCIESFTKVAVESPEEGLVMKLSKSRLTSDNGKIIATVYDKFELETITASDLEIR